MSINVRQLSYVGMGERACQNSLYGWTGGLVSYRALGWVGGSANYGFQESLGGLQVSCVGMGGMVRKDHIQGWVGGPDKNSL